MLTGSGPLIAIAVVQASANMIKKLNHSVPPKLLLTGWYKLCCMKSL